MEGAMEVRGPGAGRRREVQPSGRIGVLLQYPLDKKQRLTKGRK